MKYALVAAVFIAIRDVFSSKIARKYNYIDYIVHANIFVFLGKCACDFRTECCVPINVTMFPKHVIRVSFHFFYTHFLRRYRTDFMS